MWNGAVSSTRRMFTNEAMNFEGNLTLRKPARRSNGRRAIPLPASSSRPDHPIPSRLVGGVIGRVRNGVGLQHRVQIAGEGMWSARCFLVFLPCAEWWDPLRSKKRLNFNVQPSGCVQPSGYRLMSLGNLQVIENKKGSSGNRLLCVQHRPAESTKSVLA